MRHVSLLAMGLALAGCSSLDDLNVEPKMSAVGAALPDSALTPQPATYQEANSTYVHGGEDLFSDSRAHRVGDVLTVIIRMDEKAKLENSSECARTSSTGVGAGFGFSGSDSDGASGDFNANIDSHSRSKGEGEIDRSEEIEITLAAVVTQVMPNGNLVIKGSQEMRVNFEMRVVNIAGLVRPRDISGRNTIPYEKIAEARISYGGRGRITEVQQPGVVQQLYDRVAPF